MAYSNRFRRSHENAKTTFGSTIASLTRHALYDVTALFFVQKYKSWIVVAGQDKHMNNTVT